MFCLPMGAPRTITKRTIQAYESHCDVYLKEWNQRAYNVPLHLQAWLQHLSHHARVLDLGCGPGQDSRYLRRQGVRVVGLDLTRSFLQVARKRSPKLPVILGDIERLPFPTKTFDGIWTAASLIHIPKPRFVRVLRQLQDMTKPGGLLGATIVHGKGSGFFADQWIRGRFLSRWQKQELKQMVEKAGWEVVSLQVVANQERDGRWLNLLARRRESS